MRTYGQASIQGKSRATGHQRTELYSKREATEWDVRLDVNAVLTPDVIINNIKERLDELSYVLVSGVEHPDSRDSQSYVASDKWIKNPGMSDELHVHLCVVLHKPTKRGDVLQLLRGQRKLGDEYCAPRNAKFTYAGWVIHHAKPTFKVDEEPDIRYEHGTLPMDPFTEDTGVKVRALLGKWSSPQLKERFKGYVDIPVTVDPKEEARKQIDRKQALIERLQDEIFTLRVQLE